MPLYEFRCQCCGERFEQLIRGSTDDKQIHCPRCQGTQVDRLLSVFARSGPACTPQASGVG